MPWWNRSTPSSSSSSPRSPTSPRRGRKEAAGSGWARRAESQPRLTRQRNLRYLGVDSVGVLAREDGGRGSAVSTPVSRTASNLDCTPTRSSSSPVLLPQPLPLPEYSNGTPHREGGSGSGSGLGPGLGSSCGCPLPSPRAAWSRVDAEEANGGHDSPSIIEGIGERLSSASIIGSRLAYQNGRKCPEPVEASPGRSTFSHYRKALHDSSSVENMTFRLNIPAKSAPTSNFSSPMQSPRKSCNLDFLPSPYASPPGHQVWSAPEIPSSDMITVFSPQTSPEKILLSPDRSPLYSPTKRTPLKSRNPSAPPSPLHPKLFPENSAAWHDSNGSVSVHPLPLPPGAAVPLQSGFGHQTAGKAEVPAMTNQWQRGKLIGSGTFGNVYVATNRQTGALCAMKEVNLIADDAKSAECLKQLEQEIKVLSQLKHPNIVQYYGSEMIEDRFHIYLEYVYPGSITKYVRDHCGAMTESVVRNFTRHILNGLAYLHNTNTMHRDIKGANLLVDAHGVVKLADFGMAKHLSGAAPNLSLRGSPYWMAPEVVQATMNKDIGYDLAVDIWSLGCTIIEMFTGKHPWSDLEGAAAMFKALHKDPPLPEALSTEGKDFLRRCFRRNPAERPTASMLLEHSFIRNSNHYNLHGSIQAFAGIKLDTATYSPRERPKSKSETAVKGKQLSNGETSYSYPETSESAAVRLSPRSTLEANPSISPPHLSQVVPSPYGTSTGIFNGKHSLAGIYYPSALPKPHLREG